MLLYDRTDLSKLIDVAKSRNSKEFIICHYLFFDHALNFKILFVLIVMISQCWAFILPVRIAVIPVKRVDYFRIIRDISESESIHLLENSLLDYRGYIAAKKL